MSNRLLKSCCSAVFVLVCIGFAYWFCLPDYSTFVDWPKGTHTWTQFDHLALIERFMEPGASFWQPRTYLLESEDGIIGVDAPIHQWLIALKAKFMNYEPVRTAQLYGLVLFFMSVAALIMSLTYTSRISFFGVFGGFAYATLPLAHYYSSGILPSTWALSTTVIGLSTAWIGFQERKNWALILAFLLFGLSALTRTTHVLPLLALTLVVLGDFIIHQRRVWSVILSSALAWVAFVGWQLYKQHLTNTYGTFFLNELMPPSSFQEGFSLVKLIVVKWCREIVNVFLVLIADPFLLVLFNKKNAQGISSQFKFFLALLSLFILVFFIVMMRQFVAHEYYFLDTLYPVLIGFILIILSSLGQGQFMQWMKKSTVIFYLMIGLSFVAFFGQVFYSNSLFAAKHTNYDQVNRTSEVRQAFVGADKWLDEAGVSRDATIFVPDAASHNLPLVLSKRRGYTTRRTNAKTIQEGLENQPDYLIGHDDYFLSEVVTMYPELRSMLKPIAQSGQLTLYEIKQQNRELSAAQLLGQKLSMKFPIQTQNSSSEWEFYDILKDNEHRPGRYYLQGRVTTLQPNTQFQFVGSLDIERKPHHYISKPITITKSGSVQWFAAMIDVPKSNREDLKLNLYLYNPARHTIQIDGLQLNVQMRQD